MGKKADTDPAGQVPGGPLGNPDIRVSPPAKGGTEKDSAARPAEKDLKRLERILERVSLELKEALEAASREGGAPPPPLASVVVHKIEAPDLFPSGGEAAGGEAARQEEPCSPSLPEREFTLEEEDDPAFAGQEDEQVEEEEGRVEELPEFPQPSLPEPPPPPPAGEKAVLPARPAWILFGAGLLLCLLGAAGMFFAWEGISGIRGIRNRLEAQLQGARLTGGLLDQARKIAEETRRLQGELQARLARLSEKEDALSRNLEKATTWMASFEERAGNLEKAGAELKQALGEAKSARKESAAAAELAGRALAEAETALSHLEEFSSAVKALARIRGEEVLLAARLAGDRLRNRLAALGRKDWEPFFSFPLAKKQPDTASFPNFERGRPLPKAIRNVLDGQVLLLIPPGKMILGDEFGTGDPDERPAGEKVSRLVVRISRPFYVGKLEVTNACYQRFVLSTGHAPPPYWEGKRCPKDLLDLPVVCVSWEDAQAYCQWAGLRLLTEAEWEYCAKSPEDGRSCGPWPWGKGAPTTAVANFDPTPPLRLEQKDWRFWLRPAGEGLKGRTPWGLLQMAGNAAEWCRDWYRASWYTTLAGRGGVVEDPQGPPFGLGKVFRGGSWCSTEGELRSSARQMAGPNERFTFLGFRCARDAETVR